MNDQPANPSEPDRVFDITPPNKTAPSPTSRPLIVTNQPLQADPMMRPTQNPPAEASVTTEPTQPVMPPENQVDVSIPDAAPPAVPEENLPIKEPAADDAQSQEIHQNAPLSANDTELPKEDKSTIPQPQVMSSSVVVVRHRFSRPPTRSLLLILIALLLIIAAVDVLLDDQIIKTNAIPHTHFFQK